MYLKIATTHQPATDLGFLLHKNPANLHGLSLPFGEALIFYPQAGDEFCEAVLLLDVDPVALVRGRKEQWGTALLDHYVNDRPYAASSFLSVAMARTLRDAMAGRSKERAALADKAIPLSFEVTPLPSRGGPEVVRSLFEPLGYEVETEAAQLDPAFPDWGPAPFLTVRLSGVLRLQDALNHLYVLIPVLDAKKHYWVGSDEVEKLIARGGEWLQSHPEREVIAHRYLRRRRYADEALSLLDERFGRIDEESQEAAEPDAEEEALEKPLRLNDQRYEAVVTALQQLGARSVCDLGCGEGRLLQRLMKERALERILGIEVSTQALEKAERRLKLDRMSPSQRQRIDIHRGSLVYEDQRLDEVEAITLVEVIEHVDPERLDALERVVFSAAAPAGVVVTTPNREFNATFGDLPSDRLRHPDHRFEWTRSEFEDWARAVAARRGYSVAFEGIGEAHDQYGAPTQMALFRRIA